MKTIILCLVFAFVVAAAAFAAPSTAPSLPPMNIRKATDAQMFRYGRELYRKGDYKEAAKVFEHILTIDCKNKLAQYHLQKIAAQGAAFKGVAEFLKNLPCPAYDFSEEDFLPASLYYEKDADLILEQLTLYNQRYRSTKSELSAQISQYKDMIAQLEGKTQALSASLGAAQKDASQASLWKDRLKESMVLSARLSQEAAQLKEQLDNAKTSYAQESEALQKRVSSSGTSTETLATQQALAQKESEIAEKTQELATLQEKFSAIQERLRQIESSLMQKNDQIKGIEQDLSTIRK